MVGNIWRPRENELYAEVIQVSWTRQREKETGKTKGKVREGYIPLRKKRRGGSQR